MPGLAEWSWTDPTVRSSGVLASFVASEPDTSARANRTAVRMMQHASGLHMREIDGVGTTTRYVPYVGHFVSVPPGPAPQGLS